jgi:hypothetical protein
MCLYLVSSLQDVATINIEILQKHLMHLQRLVYAQRYSSYKKLFDANKVFPFTNKNIKSLLILTSLL